MGNNEAFSYFEETVVGAYNLGKLDKDLLEVLMKPYRGSDIDSGGKAGLTSNDADKLEVEGICIKVWGGVVPDRPNLPEDWKTWTDEQQAQNDAYYDALHEEFNKVTEAFGWE